MDEETKQGDIFGVPYNFERPSLGRLIAARWQPDAGMIVKKPFGIGYTLNLANWRSWVALLVVGVLLFQEERGNSESEDDSPVEVIVD